MAYKKDDNGGQAAASAAPANSSSGASNQSFGGNYSQGGGKGKSSAKSSVGSRDSSAHAAASADRTAAAKRGKVTAFTPSVRGGASSKPGASFSPAYVGKNPYQWGNNEGVVNHWQDDDPERQAKLDALGFAADDPDRSFHYYEPDKGSDKSYLERANSLNIDRNFFQAGNFWNTIDGPYESEDARKSDAAQWMLDAQTYGKWAKDHGLTYTDENGETRDMADAWKDIWDYANEITGGIGDSESTRAGRDIETYLAGGEYDSATTQKLLDQAKYFADNAESEKDASRWADYEKSLRIQLEADQKKEKKDSSFLGKIVNAFDRPERAEQGELTDTQKAYQQAAAEDQLYSGWATDPLSAAAFAPVAEKRDELAEQVKAENRAAGREVYAGMEDEDRLSDAAESWLGGRGAGIMAGVAGGLYAVDSAFYDNDEIRQLTQQQWQADQAFLTTGDPKFKEESEALQAQIDEAQRRAIENGENGTPLADAAGMLLDSAIGMQAESDQKWQDVTEDMSDAERMAANVFKTGTDVVADVGENLVVPGLGTMRMYLGAGGSGALEQAGRENNDPDSIATAAVTRAASAWLSTKLIGGMEGVYGESILGGITDDLISGASPAVQTGIKVLMNTEGAEEGLEDILNYGADLILNLDEEAQLNWDEVKQDAFVGYVVGVLTNGLSAGINYDSKARHALAEEALEFAQSDMSIEEAAEIAKETTKDQVVMKPPANEAQNQNMATSQNAALQGQEQNVAPAPEQNASPAVDQQQAQDMAASQNAALEGQEQNAAPAPVNQEPQNQNLAEGQAAALAGQDQNPAPAPQRAANGPSATAEPYTGPELPGASYGGGTTVKVGKTKVPVHFAVVPISELNVSHDIYGNKNQNYPGELQPRDRSRGTAQNQAIEIGTNLDPGELEWSNNATTGAPIIRPDGTVISGNGRTNGIGYALETGRGGEYTKYLRDNAERFGIDPNSVGDDSVLVRVADGDYNWQAMAEQANVSDVSRMSTTEQAGVDAERLSRYPEILDKLVPNDTGDLNTSDNADFVKEFLQAVVPTSEQGSVWTEKGGLSQEGKRRVENAVFQMAYGDASLMARLSESLDNNMKNVSNSLLALAPKVATLENNVANGTRHIGIRDTLLEGVKIFEEAKNRGVDVGKVVDQISMDSNASPEAVFIAEFLQGNAKSAKQIRTFLNAMADTADNFGDPTQIGFFDTGDTEYTSRDVLEGAIAKYEQETGNQLGRPDYDFYGDVFDTGADREGEGTDSAEADTAADRTASGIGEDSGSGEAGRAGDLASRMESGEVGEEEYLNLISSEEGRTQLANALGLNSNDTKTVADGLSVYLLLQDQLNQLQGQQNQDTAGMLLGEEAETGQNAQDNPEGVNSQAEETNLSEGVLNAQETAGNANPEQNGTETRRTVSDNARTNENTDADFDALVAKNGAIEQGEKPARDISVPKKDASGNKVGEGLRTIMEAGATPESRLGNLKAAVLNGNFGHVPVTNDTRSKNAAAKIAKDGWKKSVGDFLGAVSSGKSDADTIALGAHLLNEAGNSPEATGRDYVELAMAYNEAMTRAGQGLVAGRILKTLTPEGKLYGFEKTVEKINKDIRQKNEKRAPARQKPEVKLNEKLVQDFLNAKTDAERDAIHDKMVKDVAQQVPNTLRDKFTALRYLNMLGNLKTQVRNVVGNIGMSAVQKVKNEVVSAIEGIASTASGGKYERQYKGFYGTDLLRTARADFGSDEMLQKAAKGEAKYSDVGRQAMADIQGAKDPFSNKHPLGKFLNLYSKATNAAMEYGDLVFVRANYADALAGYLNAHNISSAQWEAMVNNPGRAADVDKARNYAIKQAQEATFRDTNSISKFVSTIDKDFPRLAKAITQGVIPFRKTPANVLVRMEEYSPLGLVNTAVNGVRAARGEASASDVIDSMAKTITGTGLAALGFFLRSKGWARTKDKDDKEEALAKLRGSQDYSVEFTLPNGKRKSFTLDWLTPASGSFFMGSELFDIVDEGGITPANAMAVLSSFTNPMLEMSMLSGVNDALSNLSDFNGDNSAMAQFVLNSAWSYLTQGISNTLAGQAEQFNEAYRQTYYTDPDNPFLPTSVQKKLAKLGNKTPGKDYQAADYIDAWGRKQKNDENIGTRAFNVFANPGYVSNMDEKTTEVDDLLADLYQFGKDQTERDDFPDVVPKTPSRSTTVNGEKLTPEEYDLYATTKGREALDAVTEFSKSDTFRNMDKFAQAETISDIYSYSAFLAASRVAESRGETYYDDKYSPLIRGIDKNGDETYKASVKRGDVPEYLAFKNAYDSAMDKKDYDAIDALLDSADRLPTSAMEGAMDRENKMGTLMELKDAGLSGAGVYYQFQDDMKNIYEGEKRTAPKSSDYIRAAGSGRYSPQDADAIMNYETTASEKTVARYQDQVRYNLEMAGMGGNYSEVWRMVQSVADGDMTKDQLKSYVERNLPIEYRQAIRDVASNYAEDRHVAGKTVSGIYRAAREAGATPKEALEFYNMIDTNYNGYYTKKEFDAACRQMFGTGETGRQVRAALQDYVGK